MFIRMITPLRESALQPLVESPLEHGVEEAEEEAVVVTVASIADLAEAVEALEADAELWGHAIDEVGAAVVSEVIGVARLPVLVFDVDIAVAEGAAPLVVPLVSVATERAEVAQGMELPAGIE